MIFCFQCFESTVAYIYSHFHRSRRIIYYLKQFNVLQADTEPLHSVYSVATKITEVARSLSALAALNIKIHLPVFKLVIDGVAQHIATPTVMPSEAAVSDDSSTISALPLESVEAEISEADSDALDETDVTTAAMAFESAQAVMSSTPSMYLDDEAST
jgi:hypothetical protein